MRDLFAGDFVAAHVDNERTHKRIVGYLKKTSPHMVDRVHRTKDKEPLFERSASRRRSPRRSTGASTFRPGGYLIFDYAEAFTVIDVNTGASSGRARRRSTQRLEDTTTRTTSRR